MLISEGVISPNLSHSSMQNSHSLERIHVHSKLLMSKHNLIFRAKIRKIPHFFYLKIVNFTVVKVAVNKYYLSHIMRKPAQLISVFVFSM